MTRRLGTPHPAGPRRLRRRPPRRRSAGSYTVSACGSYDNRSWNSVARHRHRADESLSGQRDRWATRSAAARASRSAPPAPPRSPPRRGMTIADFTLTRQLTYRNGAPANGTRRLYAIYKLGGTVFAGAGHYENATRNRLNARAPGTAIRRPTSSCPRSTVSRASFPALAGYAGDATTLQIAVGCFNGTVDTACTVAAGGGISHLLSGARVVLNDPTLPSASIEATGLLSGGRRARLRPDHARRDRQRRHPARRDRRPQRRRRRRRRRGLRGRRAHRHRRDLLVPPAQGVPEPQERDRAPDEPAGRPADAQGPRHRRRRQRDSSRARTWSTSPRRPTAGRSTAAARPRTAR